MALDSRPSADQATALQHIADGGAVVYWRPGCGFCAALDRSLARSDEQLAYYVAQAREVVDLSLLAQKQIVEDLQRIGGPRQAGNDASAAGTEAA